MLASQPASLPATSMKHAKQIAFIQRVNCYLSARHHPKFPSILLHLYLQCLALLLTLLEKKTLHHSYKQIIRRLHTWLENLEVQYSVIVAVLTTIQVK